MTLKQEALIAYLTYSFALEGGYDYNDLWDTGMSFGLCWFSMLKNLPKLRKRLGEDFGYEYMCAPPSWKRNGSYLTALPPRIKYLEKLLDQ